MDIMNLTRVLDGVYVLLDKEHAALVALLFPFLAIKMIQTYMTKLIQN